MKNTQRLILTYCLSFFATVLTFSKDAKVKLKNESSVKFQSPNVILILADDLGYSDLGCYGSEIQTPNLDKLAQQGMRFTQMHNTAKSFPSRASLLTGVYAQQNGMSVKPETIQNSISIGDLLKSAGYRTLFSGKNHSKTSLYNFGFDRVYEFLGGATNHFNPGMKRENEFHPIFKDEPGFWYIDDKVNKPYNPPKDFYSTDYFTKYAIDFLEEYKDEKQPFFLYLAFTAPHDPLMAWPEDIAKYRGKYMVGYKTVRDSRYKRMLDLGMVNPEMKLSEPTYEDWNSMTEAQKDGQDLKMAIYAAMIDRIDQNIGKLIQVLEKTGKINNTLILFLSDNGASAVNAEKGIKSPVGSGGPGTVGYWASLGESWANVCNTPYRYYKNSSYEGGICTPFIAWCPGIIQQAGSINNQPLHFIDIMATFIDLTKATYPHRFRNQEIVPIQGESFLPILKGETLQVRQEPIFWQWLKGKAIRIGDWKAVAIKDEWALYDMKTDRNETKDLKGEYPEKITELTRLYEEWASKNVPLSDQK